MEQKTSWIKIGDFFFRYRNVVFPVMWCALFIAFIPASTDSAMGQLREIAAIALVALGLALRGAVIGFAYIKRGGMNKAVYADKLVTEGFFTTCRNPLYVGNMLIYTGVFLMHGNPLVVAIGTLGSFFIYQSIIAAEEYFLRQKFGADYSSYCATTPRWLIKTGRLKAATEQMEFNFKRVLVKDYSTIANAIITLLFISGLKHYYYDAPGQEMQASMELHAMLIVATLFAAAAISRAKKWKLITL